MSVELKQLVFEELPPLLKEIPDHPHGLYLRGILPSFDATFLSVIGARHNTPYGKSACEQLVRGLAGYNVVIVSGLALGIDSVAHRTALEAGLPTIAFPGSGLNQKVIYPSTHKGLAEQIEANNGALLSEFEPNFKATPYCFPQRNRLIAGISHATLVVEAGHRSGALMTARLAGEYGRDVMAVPGSVFSNNSAGTSKLIKTGAAMITNSGDILDNLGIEKQEKKKADYSHLNEKEKMVAEWLKEPMSRDELISSLNMTAAEANILLSAMELKGLIEEKMGKIYLKI